jgi:hypothetical protein
MRNTKYNDILKRRVIAASNIIISKDMWLLYLKLSSFKCYTNVFHLKVTVKYFFYPEVPLYVIGIVQNCSYDGT